MIKTQIEQYVRENNIKSYSIVPGTWVYSDWSAGLNIGNDVCFITKLNALVSVDLITDIASKGLFFIKSTKKIIDYSNIVRFNDVSGNIQIFSDLISIHNTKILYEVRTPSIITNIYNGFFEYYLLKIKQESQC